MKHLKLCFWSVLATAGLPAHGAPIARLFASSQIWGEAPVKAKKVKRAVVNPKVQRDVATEASPTQTYVYPDSYSFQSNRAEQMGERDIAAVAMKGRVIGVRREIALTDAAAKGIEQEYLLNAGSRLGLSAGTKLKVYRTLPVVDPYNGNKQHELKVDFATLEVIHVEDDLAVAKLKKLNSPQAGPYVGLRGILVGDYISAR